MEVEDIMCDQSILHPKVNVQFSKVSYLVIPASKLWVVIDIIARSIFPPISTVCYTVFRNPQVVFQNVRDQIFPAIVAFVANNVSRSLASVQNFSLPVTLRITKDLDGHNRAVITGEGGEDADSETSEKSVECIVLFEPEDVGIDVIFLHGLHGGINKTWKQGTWRTSKHKLANQSPIRRQSSGNMYVPPKDHALKRTLSNIYSKVPKKIAKTEDINENRCNMNNEEEEEMIKCSDYSDCWPRDWIPKDCPKARIIAINYTTDVLWCPTWVKKRKRTNLTVRSSEMIDELIKLGVGRKPIMWVGHSKGGLYIKQMMITAFENSERIEVRNIFNQSKAIMWYSVPHKGSTLADFNLPLLRRSVELLELQRNCNFILDLHSRFLDVIKREKPTMDIFSFIETSFTLMSFIYLKIVAYESADAKIGVKCDVPLDHREICKPAGRDCFLYIELMKLIKKYCENNDPLIM